ncbi:MAG: heterotetrameric sarcosine oxidase alpha subunit [Parasphingorhabdus sp.]|jgi:heterotetrameric sarcosine oxidase alpha subunit
MQPGRLNQGGDIDRNRPLQFTFNNRSLQGYQGDSLASALLANNISVIARSIKYHRPRGIVSAGLEESSALVTYLDRHGIPVPNLKATEVQLENNLVVRSQNCWPHVNFDIAALLQLGSAMLGAGFYYKTFMWPKDWWHLCYEKIIRRTAGQGSASTRPDTKQYDRRRGYCDLLIIGSGPSGLAAAVAAADKDLAVILMEQDHLLGGSCTWEQTEIESLPARQWRQQALATIKQHPNIRIMTNCLAFGLYDHGCVMAVEQNTAVVDSVSWQIRADRILLACGATEQPLVFPNNDRPGIMLAASVRQYIYRYAVQPGKRAMLVITNPEELELTRQALLHAGIDVAGELKDGESIIGTIGRRRLRAVTLIDSEGNKRKVSCDLMCMSAGWNPNVHLAGQLSIQLNYDSNRHCLLPPEQAGSIYLCGAARGHVAMDDCVEDGRLQAFNAIAEVLPQTARLKLPEVQTYESSLVIHTGPGPCFVDHQNDVLRTDIELAVREGYKHIELVKRYTTLGMGTDQGKTSWINATRQLEELTQSDANTIGHTSFRPPYSPVKLGALIGAEVNQHMTPTRQTPFHRAFSNVNCVFQTSGSWVYSRHFPFPGESMEQAITREVLAVRNQVGCVDMSTLGKVDVKGTDALEFLSRLYCNNIENIKPGRLRYALMLREDGILWDDGTVAQLGTDHFLVTMTTANSDAVWRWMNKLLQLHWTELDVQITLVSDHWASLAVAGPNARNVLQKLNPSFAIDRESFPFASVREGKLENEVPCRVFSVSFSGELSYEINVPAGYADWLFDSIMSHGKDDGITAYGLETLDVLRIEKGHLSVGTEIDGRTTPMDLGLAKMVSGKKSFIGSSLLQRPELNRSTRLQLVGLTPSNGVSAIPVAALLCDQPWQAGVAQSSVGRLTAALYSPSLQKPIALALLENGQQRHNDKLWAVSPIQQKSIKVTIGPACFYDSEGERLHA